LRPFCLPLVTAPTEAGQATDLGDLTLLDVFSFRAGGVELGVGPLFVPPTATDRASGAGKWQAGAAGVLIAPQTQGLLGALVTYQHSLAGPPSRSDVSLMTVQPLILYNLPQGWYLRSSAIWVFDFVGDSSYVPIGFGLGKVIRTSGPTVNVYLEPQGTAWKADGLGIPKWQILGGRDPAVLDSPALEPHDVADAEPTSRAVEIVLSHEERTELEGWARRRTGAAWRCGRELC
jgi:hypothetical protein